jgi:hypothetical protein
VSAAGALEHGADEVLDSPTSFGLCTASGDQVILPSGKSQIPSLFPYFAQRALRTDAITAPWTPKFIYANNGIAASDALRINHPSGGFYAQFWSTNQLGVPRTQTILEFIKTLGPLASAPRSKR